MAVAFHNDVIASNLMILIWLNVKMTEYWLFHWVSINSATKPNIIGVMADPSPLSFLLSYVKRFRMTIDARAEGKRGRAAQPIMLLRQITACRPALLPVPPTALSCRRSVRLRHLHPNHIILSLIIWKIFNFHHVEMSEVVWKKIWVHRAYDI